MKTYFPIILLVLAILYIASPYDLLPDLFPFLGWIDDTAVLALMFYYFRNGKFPDFITRFIRNLLGLPQTGSGTGNRTNNHYQKTNGRTGSGQNYNRGASGSNTGKSDPHKILGVRPGASPDEIHSAYRRLAHQYHPDKVSHLGAEFQKMAEKKFIEIQDAYEALLGRRP